MQKVVTSGLSESELSDLTGEISDAYGVDASDVTLSAQYETTGTLSYFGNIDDEAAAIAEIETAIADLLGVHEANVDVEIVDGVVHYTVSADNADDVLAAQATLLDEESLAALDEAVSLGLTGLNVDPDVSVQITATVDTSAAENNLNQAAQDLRQTLENEGYSTDIESNSNVCKVVHRRRELFFDSPTRLKSKALIFSTPRFKGAI